MAANVGKSDCQPTGELQGTDPATSARHRTLREVIARWIAVVAVAVLVYGGIVLAYAWCDAALTGRLPSASDARYYEQSGNGPWDHVNDLNSLVQQATSAPLLAAGIALLALLVRPTGKGAGLFAVSLAIFFVLLVTHFWLID
jgi:hypothetical protein